MSTNLDAKEAADGWEAFPDGQSAAASYKDDVKARLEEQAQRSAQPQQDDLATWPWPLAGTNGTPAARAVAADAEILSLEPPLWVPDSQAGACGSCHLAFRPLTRLKHHCRMCGKIFCHACCHKRLLLPPKFPSREPQRCCELCCSLLLPLQPFLAGTQAAAVQPPVHDSIDSVSLRSWLNSPWSSTLEGDIYKAANILHTFTRTLRLSPEAALPPAMLSGARALVLLSAAKLSAGWSASIGTGVMVSRDPGSGEWSAPCAVALIGMGWGLQLGGELADLMLVLRSEQQLQACCAGSQLGLGGNLGMAVGPVGRHADAAVMLGTRGASAPVFSYSCSKGAFVGASLEGSLLMVRPGVNEKFYGYSVSAQQLMMQPGLVPPPQAASMLYDALHVLVEKYEVRTPLTPAQLQEHLEREREAEAAAAVAMTAGSGAGEGGADRGGGDGGRGDGVGHGKGHVDAEDGDAPGEAMTAGVEGSNDDGHDSDGGSSSGTAEHASTKDSGDGSGSGSTSDGASTCSSVAEVEEEVEAGRISDGADSDDVFGGMAAWPDATPTPSRMPVPAAPSGSGAAATSAPGPPAIIFAPAAVESMSQPSGGGGHAPRAGNKRGGRAGGRGAGGSNGAGGNRGRGNGGKSGSGSGSAPKLRQRRMQEQEEDELPYGLLFED